MKYLHTMVRIKDIDKSLDFYCDALGLREVRRKDVPSGKFTLIFLRANDNESELELTYNWDNQEDHLSTGRSFGHLAYEVENIYEFCQKLIDKGITLARPPRDGRMAFIRSPDGISIELLQKGEALDVQFPWSKMENVGVW